MTIAGSISARAVLPYWGLYLGLGIVEMIVSFWLLNRPGLTLVATVIAIGLWSMIYGRILKGGLSFAGNHIYLDGRYEALRTAGCSVTWVLANSLRRQ